MLLRAGIEDNAHGLRVAERRVVARVTRVVADALRFRWSIAAGVADLGGEAVGLARKRADWVGLDLVVGPLPLPKAAIAEVNLVGRRVARRPRRLTAAAP